MTNRLTILLAVAGLLLVFNGVIYFTASNEAITGAPPYGEFESEIPNLDPYAWVKNWKRPDGPARVGLQVGHWGSKDFPDELAKLRNNTGATGGGIAEWEVNKKIAEETAAMLEKEGVIVDILPATVPVSYQADLFVAIHADGSEDTRKSGFKLASPWRDYTGNSAEIVRIIEEEYAQATGLEKDPNITRNMRGYYAFSWWKYEHSVHPATTSLIIETGFLTNSSDRRLLFTNPEVPAGAISKGILIYLNNKGLTN
ncbi:N-acetylmuramoyl-L-alanine amidase [Candidatus Woesebacteria bacterium]|nr:MAG: N-acetylmuramoyl-L-alanine amidase [Candidatus Woesebacteria bacterium]